MWRLIPLPLVSRQAKQNSAANISTMAMVRARNSSGLAASMEATSSRLGGALSSSLRFRFALVMHSHLPGTGTSMPVPQGKPRDERQRAVDEKPGEGDQRQSGEHARDVQAIAGLGDAEGKAGALPCGAAASSATIAPISARPPPMRKPPRK